MMKHVAYAFEIVQTDRDYPGESNRKGRQGVAKERKDVQRGPLVFSI